MYLCIDLKSFYASVELVERHLDSMTSNLVVADTSRGRGALCLAVSPSLKSIGVRNRCRLFEIPSNIRYLVAKPRMSLYIKYSALIYQIYLRYVSKDDIHPYSIDEMFLDLGPYKNYYKKDIFAIAQEIISTIKKETGITATCGIGTNMYLAKVALDILAKHAKDYIAYLDEETYLRTLSFHEPLTDFWQIAGGIASRLKKYKIYNMKGLQEVDMNILTCEFGINAGILKAHAYGRDETTIKDIKNYKPLSKSLSLSQILFHDYTFLEARDILKEMVLTIVLELVKKNLTTSNISLHIAYTKGTHKSFSKQQQIFRSASLKEILAAYLNIYDKCVLKEGLIRHIGLSFSRLESYELITYNLFSNLDSLKKEHALIKTINDIKNKYGKNSLLQANNLLTHSTQKIRNTLIGGHHA